MGIDQPVVGDPPDLASLHGTSLTKEAELVRERRHAHAKDERDVAHAQVFVT